VRADPLPTPVSEPPATLSREVGARRGGSRSLHVPTRSLAQTAEEPPLSLRRLSSIRLVRQKAGQPLRTRSLSLPWF
jgi:hypothetical protein